MEKSKRYIFKSVLIIICISLLISSNTFLGVSAKTTTSTVSGKVVNVVIPSPSLANNIVGEDVNQKAVVYLPSSYDKSKKSYPVVYYLPGWGDNYSSLIDGNFNKFKLPDSVDALIKKGTIKDMIIVVPYSISKFIGSFYVNSSVTGNWEDFIVTDMVKYIDSKYRTIKNPNARGISGHSMGGFGALNAAMKHPEVFGNVYSMSPGLFDKDGLANTFMFNDEATIKEFIDIQNSLKDKPLKEGRKELFENLATEKYSFYFAFALSYGAAFSPNTKNVVPVDYPFSLVDGKVVKDQKVWDTWFNGFGSIEKQAAKYKSNLLKLGKIGIEYGKKDDNAWIPQGCESLSKELKKQKVPFTLATFDGGHQDKLGERLEKAMLPFFSQAFVKNKLYK